MIGHDKLEEVQAMKASGASADEMSKRIDEFVAKSTDAAVRERASKYAVGCKRLFGVSAPARRLRRDEMAAAAGAAAHPAHRSLDDFLASHLKWLSDEQKATLRTMKSEGKTRQDLHAKVFDFYDATSGDAKKAATADMQVCVVLFVCAAAF